MRLGVCTEPGCPELAEGGGRCPTHDRDARRANDARRPSGAARGSTRAWARFRSEYLREHPTCTAPGCSRPAQDIHHLDGGGRTGARAYDPTNLQALCHPCHASITAREQRLRPAPAAPERRRYRTGSPGLR